MNLILFEAAELALPLKRTDPRAAHLLGVLHRKEGDTFDAGIVNGPRGKGTLVAVSPEGLTLAFAWGPPPLPPDPITLFIGLPRPQTARDILREATSLGTGAIHFFRPDKCEAGYAQSKLWSSGEWRKLIVRGAEQAFDPRLPEVTHTHTLAELIAMLPHAATRLALDNYESNQSLGTIPVASPAVLAFGPERGWSAAEREQLRGGDFALVHLGQRVLRSETAVITALALLRMKLGLL